MNRLETLIQEIESYLDSYSLLNPKISSVPVSWQLHHSLSVIINVSKVLLKTEPKNYKKDFNITRVFIFITGIIPRGKGKSPAIVNKQDLIEKEEIIELINVAKSLVNKHNSIQKNAYFKHQVFGMLNKKNTIKFLIIHTEHHLKIVREILNK